MYYERFEELCNLRGVKPGTVSKATGIPSSTLTNWKQGNYTPKQHNLKKVADYFNVSIDYLMGREECCSEFTAEQAKFDLMFSQDLELKEALKLYFSLTDVKKKHIIETIKMMSEGEK